MWSTAPPTPPLASLYSAEVPYDSKTFSLRFATLSGIPMQRKALTRRKLVSSSLLRRVSARQSRRGVTHRDTPGTRADGPWVRVFSATRSPHVKFRQRCVVEFHGRSQIVFKPLHILLALSLKRSETRSKNGGGGPSNESATC